MSENSRGGSGDDCVLARVRRAARDGHLGDEPRVQLAWARPLVRIFGIPRRDAGVVDRGVE